MAAYVIANENAKQEFNIPVTWEVYDTVKVQASSLKEAYEYVQEHLDEIPLGCDPDYAEDSYKISASLEECEAYNLPGRTKGGNFDGF